jgi:hypothetical protein
MKVHRDSAVFVMREGEASACRVGASCACASRIQGT